MSVPILSCPCGLRMKAKGATPGRVGRCPKCGRTLKVPETPKEPADVEAETEAAPVARGYGVQPAARPSSPAPIAAEFGHSPERTATRKKTKGTRRPDPSTKLPEVTRTIEPWWRPDVLFPTRGAEGLMMVASLGLSFWVLTVLVPELCLEFVNSASFFGAAMMGYLIALVAALPSLAFTPVAIVYALQYHGRVLVSGAMGEVVPPRPPDRNFDGLWNGIGPWVVWLTCGATIGFGPLACYLFSRGWGDPVNPLFVMILASVGLPYALMSLMMAFLHEQGMPRPFAVVGALLRLNVAFLGISAIVGGLGMIVWGTFAAVLAMLAAECLAQWMAIVAMRVLGVFYHHHASILRWHREKPWWGMTWGM
jgi:hypothetical protein